MAGTKLGGLKAKQTNLEKHGEDFYERIGGMGGRAFCSMPKGFAANPALARLAGQIGGKISKRGKAKKK